MKPNLTKKEIQIDLQDTIDDIECLEEITRWMEKFIVNSGGESRDHLRVDLMKWGNIKQHGYKLKEKIEEALIMINKKD